jgi:hypothetical protein
LDAAKHYTASADPTRAGGRIQYWIQVYHKKLQRLKMQTNGDFKIIVIGDQSIEQDYWSIPYRVVEAVLTQDTVRTKGKKYRKPAHWMIQIKKPHEFTVFSGHGKETFAVNVQDYYGVPF